MKYAIMGFSQKAVMDLNSAGFKIDVSDLAILRWLSDFSHTEKMVKVFEDGRMYYWVNYQSVLDDLPILNIGRRMLSNRMQKMVDAGILCSSLKKTGGTFTYYGFGPAFEKLVSQDFDMGDNKLAEGCQKNDTPPANGLTPPLPKNLQPKYPSTNDQSTNNKSTKNSRLKKPFTPPTLEEVCAYCKEKNFIIDPNYFYEWYKEAGWMKSNGEPVSNWKTTMMTWNKKERERNNEKGGNNNAGSTAARGKETGVSKSGGTIVECPGGGFVRFG